METINGSASAGPDLPLLALPPQSVPVFKEGIGLILSRWWALQMAIENEWGGRRSRAIAEQLFSDIFSWFTQSKEPLYIDDLENILQEAMLSLNTMAEDDSIEEVAEKLMIMHEECLECNYQSIIKLRESTSQLAAHSHVRRVVNDDEDDDDSTDGDDNTSDMMVDAPEQPKSDGNSAIGSTSESRPKETAEDGWTVVSSRRNKGMAQVNVKIISNGRWEVTTNGGCKYVGLSRRSSVTTTGIIVPKRISYVEFYRRVSNCVQCDSARFKMELKAMDISPDGTPQCIDIIDEDVLDYVLSEDRFPPQICVDMVERINDDDFEVAADVADNFEDIHFEQTISHVEEDLIPTDIPIVPRVKVFGTRQKSNQVPRMSTTASQPHMCPETPEYSHCGTFINVSQQSAAEQDRQTEVPHDACPSQQTRPVYNGDPYDEAGLLEDTRPSHNASNRGNEWVIPGAEHYSWQEVHRDIRPTADIDGIFKGKFFPEKKDLQRVLGLYAVENNFKFKVHRSTKSLFHVVCKKLNCTWKCRAVRLREGTYWQVRGWVAEHSCCRDEC